MESIGRETDWGFVIKAHALIEAALTDLFTARFKEPLLRDIISTLSTSSEHFSKLSVLKELKLILKERRAFIRAFSRVRNAFAHDVRKIDFTLKDYCDEDAKRAAELRAAIAHSFPETLIVETTNPETKARQRTPTPREKFIMDDLRLALWLATVASVNELLQAKACLADPEAPPAGGGKVLIPHTPSQNPKG